MQQPSDKPEELPDDERTPWSRVRWVLGVFFGANLAIAGAHIAWPARVDLTAMAFFELSIAPLILLLFRTFEFGFGDWRIGGRIGRFVPVARALSTLSQLDLRTEPLALSARQTELLRVNLSLPEIVQPLSDRESAPAVAEADDDVVFVRLRRELERRLRRIAAANGIASRDRTAGQLADELARAGILEVTEANALRELMRAGNAQAHGERIPTALAEYARAEAPGIVSALNRLSWAPHSEMEQRIRTLAAENGRQATSIEPIPVGDRLIRPDMIVDDDLVVEIPSVEAVSDTFSLTERVKRYKTATGKRVLCVLPLKVGTDRRARTIDALETDSDVAVAWHDHDRFDGTDRARIVAPWLFGDSTHSDA